MAVLVQGDAVDAPLVLCVRNSTFLCASPVRSCSTCPSQAFALSGWILCLVQRKVTLSTVGGTISGRPLVSPKVRMLVVCSKPAQ